MTDAPSTDATGPTATDSVVDALKGAVASVEAAIVRLEGEDAAPDTVERLLSLVEAPALGDVVARHNALTRAAAIVDHRGTLPDTDWAPLADLGTRLDDTVDRLQGHASALLDETFADTPVHQHLEYLQKAAVDESLGETLQLLVLIEDCLFLWHRVRIARDGSDPQVVAAARAALARHFEGDGDLLRRARCALARFAEGSPLEVVRRLSSSRTTRVLSTLRHDLDDYRAAFRADEAGWLADEDPEVAEALDSIDSPLKAVGGALGDVLERSRARVTETLSRDDGDKTSAADSGGP
ncbi:hypothetical protein ACIBED_16465 [Rhodococcus coprophilus]|uniref:hypothetical protein n=1 Tax=Rhodococcus coprophilus TaxID=38310 RepID=UPI0033EBD010